MREGVGRTGVEHGDGVQLGEEGLESYEDLLHHRILGQRAREEREEGEIDGARLVDGRADEHPYRAKGGEHKSLYRYAKDEGEGASEPVHSFTVSFEPSPSQRPDEPAIDGLLAQDKDGGDESGGEVDVCYSVGDGVGEEPFAEGFDEEGEEVGRRFGGSAWERRKRLRAHSGEPRSLCRILGKRGRP